MQQRNPAALKPYEKNSRLHSASQIDDIRKSIREFGFIRPVVIDEHDVILAGHGAVVAACEEGLPSIPVHVISYLSERQKRAYVIADNKLAQKSTWNFEMLTEELNALSSADYDLGLTGFDEQEIDAILKDDMGILPENWASHDPVVPHTVEVSKHTRVIATESNDEDDDDDDVPEDTGVPVTALGDVWLLDGHRVMCGDSRSTDDVAILMNGSFATLLHGDPPYGMGKQSDGVTNDNLYNEKLDAFQMSWWNAFRPFLVNNASAYIWGNAVELWRLWFVGGLSDSEVMELRNEIVWDKKSAPGMASATSSSYTTTTERCLFLQLGDQFRTRVNSDSFLESWEVLRVYLFEQAEAAGIKPADIRRVCGVHMYSHWFSRSQFTLIPEKHYETLAGAYPGFFVKPWSELKAQWYEVKQSPDSDFQKQRAYFDNAHDIMRDVWEFPRVVGADRYGHATPKPVEMIERCVISSSRPGEVVVEPFGGSGPTLIACEKLGRICRMMELEPHWVDVIVRRWQAFTGKQAIHAVDGITFDQMAQIRNGATE